MHTSMPPITIATSTTGTTTDEDRSKDHPEEGGGERKGGGKSHSYVIPVYRHAFFTLACGRND